MYTADGSVSVHHYEAAIRLEERCVGAAPLEVKIADDRDREVRGEKRENYFAGGPT